MDGVPTLIFDDGQLISGNMPYEEMKRSLRTSSRSLRKINLKSKTSDGSVHAPASERV